MRWFPLSLAFVFAGASIILSTAAGALITVGALDTPGDTYDVEVVGTLAYVADYRSGLRVIDISDPTLRMELGFRDTLGYAMDVEVVGSLAYVASGYSGLRAFVHAYVTEANRLRGALPTKTKSLGVVATAEGRPTVRVCE